MIDFLERLDFWFMLVTLATVAWIWLRDRVVAPFQRRTQVSTVSSDDYVTPNDAAPRQTAADPASGGLSGGLSALSGLQRHALLSIIMDKGFTVVEQRAVATPKRLVFALVALGWSTSQIRQVVKGDNNALSEQIREAREYFGLTDERVIGVGRDGRQVRL